MLHNLADQNAPMQGIDLGRDISRHILAFVSCASICEKHPFLALRIFMIIFIEAAIKVEVYNRLALI